MSFILQVNELASGDIAMREKVWKKNITSKEIQ